MLVYILRRLALTLSVIVGAITLTFVIFYLGPSDPVAALCPRNCTANQQAQIERKMGLDQPRIQQYGQYMKGLVAGREIGSGPTAQSCDAPCLGWSFIQNRPVKDIVFQVLPVTLSILIGGAVVYVIFGLAFGVIAARNRGNCLDRFIVGVTQTVPAVPYYVLALLFYLYLMVLHPILPQAGYTSPFENPFAWITGFIGVWMLYGLYAATGYVRYVRANMIDALAGDYVRTARSKGLSEWKVTISHALRATMAPFLTLVGLNLVLDIGGAIFTENIFGLQGMGYLSIQSFNNSDLQVISGIVVVTAIVTSVGNLVVDLLYGVVDPRVKLS